MLEKILRVNALYDFYQPLLTSKQQEYLNLYYLNDFSLGEIAEKCQVTRQAVYDNLKRAEAALEAFEEKLGLLRKYRARLSLISELREQANCLSGEEHRKLNSALDKLENLD
ncbi:MULTISPECIES: putative DNA-binding protein [unclassified Sporolactobacillus]|uniref:putative DNA-binding protein n=1 Tax=unclassified Sporolactobacillus TaxID=2628533 RepID=UPI0023682BFA|nr:putative DNA-binding protein [Sporolactobacillus sp. CQH2019]MDD9147089.1 putative DNA-binding protein [Sporolactobacillus sp. CQH2019]